MADREPVDFAETMGGLKADMQTVKGQVSDIFAVQNDMRDTLVAYVAKEAVLAEEAAKLNIPERVEELENTHHRIKWMFFGAGGAGLFGGATMWETIRTMLGKGP